MHWRLGIDLGTNSLGWWAFRLRRDGKRWHVAESMDGGVYIFPDGREPAKGGRVGDSNAVNRRMARGMRRNRDRRKSRLRAFMRKLVELGLMPADRVERDVLFQVPRKAGTDSRYNPYRLRAEALSRTLEPYELGRALFHLGLRRGFKSNRIEQSDDDGGNLKERMDELSNSLNGKTLGQFQWERLQAELKRQKKGEQPNGIRFRGDGEFYPSRAMYAAEFDAIRERQSPHHALTAADWDRLRDRYVLFQWPLKPVERGACEFYPEEQRHWRDTPIGHDFRIYQELNNLRWFDSNYAEHGLDAEQRNVVLDLLLSRKSDVKFDSLRKQKRADGTPLFPECKRFNLESEKRKALKHHGVAAALSKSPALKTLWDRRQSPEGDGGFLDDIYMVLLDEADPDALQSRLTGDFELDAEAVDALAALRLSRATASVSRRFMEAIVPIMRDQGLEYWDAVKELVDDQGLPFHHSHRPGSGDRQTLPYYGEILRGSMLGGDSKSDPVETPEKHFGKINNPTVHVALNSLRRVLNTLIERFGEPPTEVHIELSRDLKKGRKERDEITARQAREERRNEDIRNELRKHGIAHPSALDVKKIKLWEELGDSELSRLCPFSGKPISFAQLINGDAEIEHILPFKRTLDDSMSNLTVAMRWANRLKGNRTPYEAFASDTHKNDGIDWETVSRCAARLPGNKSWRFGPDAMKRFEGENDFIARQLTDNAYIARSAVRYIGCLEGVEQIVPNRGGLTAMLRGKWRLNGILSDDNRKSREDHRHHAIDAAVIGLADRAMLQGVSSQTARGADDRVHIEIPDLDPGIERAIRDRVPEIVVAYKPDHGWQGGMFKDTAYGFVTPDRRDPDFPEHNLVVSKKLPELTAKERECIRDPLIRKAVAESLENAERDGEKTEKALARFASEQGIKSVRILVKDQTVRPIPSAPYKGYKSDAYVCCDIWRLPKGKPGSWKSGEFRWEGVFWPCTMTANGVPAPENRKPHPSAKFVTRIFKDDLIAVLDGDNTAIKRVVSFNTPNQQIVLSEPSDSTGDRKNHSAPVINTLGSQRVRRLHVRPDGSVRGLQE